MDIRLLQEEAKDIRVLYVESSPQLRVQLSKLLHEFLEHVYTAKDADEAIELFKQHAHHLVITDVDVSQMNGFSLTKHLLKLNPQVKVILIAPTDEKEMLYKAMEVGVFRYIKKPLKLALLKQAIHQAVLEIKKTKRVEYLEDKKEKVEDATSPHIQKSESPPDIFELLKQFQLQSHKVSIHNYYKGVSITNEALIVKIDYTAVTFKTTYIQLKALQFASNAVLASEELPSAVVCNEISKILFEQQVVELSSLAYIHTSPIMRRTPRLEPEETHSVTLFLNDKKFVAEMRVKDISIDALNIELNALPPSIEYVEDIKVEIVLELAKAPLVINSKVAFVRKHESRNYFNLVFRFVNLQKRDLIRYITKRQMAIIREFKGLQNG